MTPRGTRRGARQRGVALITSLLVAALGSLLAVSMSHSQQVEIRRTENLVKRAQAAAYADALTDWARVILARDAREDASQNDPIDAPGEPWATLLPPIVVEEGSLWGRIEDLQGRLNLNDLLGETAANAATRRRFRRLLDHLEIDYRLLDALLDWQDADSDARGAGGAEDDYYSRLQPPYRPANTAFTDVSELRLVRGVTPQVYRRLAPQVTALPAGTPLNVNTAGPLVLASLSDGLDPAGTQALIARQRDPGFASVEAFAAQEQFAHFPVDTAGLAVSSSHFLVTAAVVINDFSLRQQNNLLRTGEGEGSRVLSLARRYGGFD